MEITYSIVCSLMRPDYVSEWKGMRTQFANDRDNNIRDLTRSLHVGDVCITVVPYTWTREVHTDK